MMNEQNNRAIPEFEGYSPFEMFQILHFTFEKDSLIQLQKVTDSDYQKIPIFKQIKYLADLIDKNGEIKLTSKGYLPTKIVSDIYQQGFIKDEFIDEESPKLFKEMDLISVNLTRILMELSGLVKKRNGKLSLTKKSKKIFDNNYEFLRLIVLTFTNKFNWAYCDEYDENYIGQLGYGFSLILLAKYGNEKRLNSFYAEKYFKAFPQLLDSVEPIYGTLETYSTNCYSVRTFDRFLEYFGLVNIEKKDKWFDSKSYITKTDLFDRLIKCTLCKI
ncbi:MAG: hypothetical protein PHY08_08450 [Candidatus Cloacimonetes bacterium]|nr:hypothetical protein [Candidatus Cloacimonadota bacterium]